MRAESLKAGGSTVRARGRGCAPRGRAADRSIVPTPALAPNQATFYNCLCAPLFFDGLVDGFGDRFDIQTLYNSCAGKFPQGFLVNFNSTDTAAAAGVSRCVASRVDMDPDYVNPFADFNLDEFLSGTARAPPGIARRRDPPLTCRRPADARASQPRTRRRSGRTSATRSRRTS